MNWTELKIAGFKIVGELAKDEGQDGAAKLESLKAEVKPLLETSLDGIIETLPLGIKQAVEVVWDHGGKDFVLMFLVPLLAEELYQAWKALHQNAKPALTGAAKPAVVAPKPAPAAVKPAEKIADKKN